MSVRFVYGIGPAPWFDTMVGSKGDIDPRAARGYVAWVAGLPTRVGNCDGDPRRCAGATMPGEFTLVIKARRQVWDP